MKQNPSDISRYSVYKKTIQTPIHSATSGLFSFFFFLIKAHIFKYVYGFTTMFVCVYQALSGLSGRVLRVSESLFFYHLSVSFSVFSDQL